MYSPEVKNIYLIIPITCIAVVVITAWMFLRSLPVAENDTSCNGIVQVFTSN